MKRNVRIDEWKEINAGSSMVDYNALKRKQEEFYERLGRVQNYFENTEKILDEIEKEFEQQTKLNSMDIKFLFLAIALQCIRQYVLTPFLERLDDKTVAKKVKGKIEEHSNRQHRLYCPTLDEIITNPVPFDTNFGSKDFNLGIGGGFSHRAKTLGHDPLLGWIFGTMNICTSTMTTWNFESYHIETGYNVRGCAIDKIAKRADTSRVILYTKDRFFSGREGRIAVASSLIKEGIHLKSDINSKVSLPLPIVSTISPELAKNLADYGLDMGNVMTVGQQALYASLINSMIAMLHGLCFEARKHGSWSLYEAKTRKILALSGGIASTSNVIFVAVNSYLGNSHAKRYLDLGGFSVALMRLFTDATFICSVKEEFITNKYMKGLREL